MSTDQVKLGYLYAEIVSSHDVSRFDELVAPGYVNHNASAEPGLEGVNLAMPRRATPSPCALSTSGGSRMDASSSTGTNSIHSTSSSRSAQCRPPASRHDTAGPGSHKT